MSLPFNIFTPLGWLNRAKLVKDNKVIQQQLGNAARDLQTLRTPFSNLVPKLAVGGAGLATAKIAADTISPVQTNQAQQAYNATSNAIRQAPKYIRQTGQQLGNVANTATSSIPGIGIYTYASSKSVDFSKIGKTHTNHTTAEFIDPITTAVALENALAGMHWNIKNGRLRKQLKAIEQELGHRRQQVPKTLAAIGLGTTAVATPVLSYMNGKTSKAMPVPENAVSGIESGIESAGNLANKVFK